MRFLFSLILTQRMRMSHEDKLCVKKTPAIFKIGKFSSSHEIKRQFISLEVDHFVVVVVVAPMRISRITIRAMRFSCFI